MEYDEYTQSYRCSVAYKVHIGKKELKYFKRIFEAFDEDHDGYCDMEHLATSLRASGFLLTDQDVENIRMYNNLRDASQFTLSNFFVMIANERRRLVSTLGPDYVHVQNQQCKHGFCGLYINIEGKSRKLLRSIPGSKRRPPPKLKNGKVKQGKSPYEKNLKEFKKNKMTEWVTKVTQHGTTEREEKGVDWRPFSLPCEILGKKLAANVGHPLSEKEYDAFTTLLEREYMHLSHDRKVEDPRVVYQNGRIHEYDPEGLYSWVCENLERFENEEVEGGPSDLDVGRDAEENDDEIEEKEDEDEEGLDDDNQADNKDSDNKTSALETSNKGIPSQNYADAVRDADSESEDGDSNHNKGGRDTRRSLKDDVLSFDDDEGGVLDDDEGGMGLNFDEEEESNEDRRSTMRTGKRVEGEETENAGVRSYMNSDPMSITQKQRAMSKAKLEMLAQAQGP